MKNTKEHFAAAMKRKDVKELGAIILEDIYGDEAAAKELRDASRVTDALINRTCVATTGASEPEESEQEETAKTAEPEETELETQPEPEEQVGGGEVKSEDTLNIGQIKDLLKKGDEKSFKKAKKAFKAQFAEDHPNYDELKKLIKKAKKALEK